MLSDQLANVDSPVSNQRLVLQLVAGLSDGYDGVATIIQQSDPLPPFYKARSMLTLEESRKSKQASISTSTPNAFVANTGHSNTPTDGPPPSSRYDHRSPTRQFDRSQTSVEAVVAAVCPLGAAVEVAEHHSIIRGSAPLGLSLNHHGHGSLHNGPCHHARIRPWDTLHGHHICNLQYRRHHHPVKGFSAPVLRKLIML